MNLCNVIFLFRHEESVEFDDDCSSFLTDDDISAAAKQGPLERLRSFSENLHQAAYLSSPCPEIDCPRPSVAVEDDDVSCPPSPDDDAFGDDVWGLGPDGSNAGIPTTVQMDSFRKTLNSATSMVFHRSTGLPLSSSPAPLRKGKSKFDYDSSISKPTDIKR